MPRKPFDDVADIVLIFKQHECTRYNIGYEAFRAEADYQRQNADACDNGRDVDTDYRKSPAEDDDEREIFHEAARKRYDRPCPVAFGLKEPEYEDYKVFEQQYAEYHNDKLCYRKRVYRQHRLQFLILYKSR